MRESNFILSRYYRNFGLIFFSLSLIFLIFVFYLTWAKVTIVITAAAQKISQDFIVEVKEGAVIDSLADKGFVSGKVETIEVQDKTIFSATGSKASTGKLDTVGEVLITNNNTKEQTLVATTRLADPKDPEKTLVRLKNTVTVPAGGSVKAVVYPENPDDFKTISPMRFIIPGLWGVLKEKIYAENEKPLGEVSSIIVVTKEDLDQAEKTLKDKLKQQAITQSNQNLEPSQTLWPKLVSIESSSASFDAKAGDEVSEFSAEIKLKTIVVAFNEGEILSLAREKLKAGLGGDKQLVTVDSKNLSYTLEKYNSVLKTAQIKVHAEGGSVLSQASQLLNKDGLLGKTAEEVKSYLSQYPEIQSVEVKFSPSWLKKTPRIKDKIKIEVR